MNIFYLSESPSEAAKSLCDVHLRKMIVETCQLLQTHDILHGKERKWKPFGESHPCRKALENPANYRWLKLYLSCLLNEYEWRFNKVHKCQEIRDAHYEVGFWEKFLGFFSDNITFPSVMPVQCITSINPTSACIVENYRNYYRYKKEEFAKKGIKWTYTKTKEPCWLK